MAATPKGRKGGSEKAKYKQVSKTRTKKGLAVEQVEDEDEIGSSQNMDPLSMLKSLEGENKKVVARQKLFQSQKATIFAQARENASEVVKEGVFMIDEMKAKVALYTAAEISFHHYFQEIRLPSTREQDTQEALLKKAPDLTQTNQLGPQRAGGVEDAATTLHQIPSMCEENEHRYSKALKADLKTAKKKERDAEDAAILIANLKKNAVPSRFA
ncbi:hypothetical protein CPB83DRAFT_856866 [Crepidotus variabilis]|uniref:Uncharacterized protein n=1 Tax=Crepidotus variabilis TaxID=179855 RepID=A0A9P6EDJ6_9AGAR|nr:hypothetical protein CPB83DRAFT_856866 [Crepidotus variabilis]